MSAGSRAERRALNQRAHAIRRELTDRDYMEARERGDAITWREVWETYAAVPAATVVAELAGLLEPAPVAPVAVAPARKRGGLPPALAELHARYSEARAVWEAGLDEAMAGARRDGKPARGETYIDEERDYRAAHPAPVWREWLQQYGRERRGMAEAAQGAAA